MFSSFAFGLPDEPRQVRGANRRLWLFGIPTTLAWAVAGWSGALGLLDNFRLMSLNRVGAWGPTRDRRLRSCCSSAFR
ncbi:hypothetical protein [Amycolatopsis sp. WGS_07]|uniref:hypothetical protein n=1 Tax=Amycolatopsis sp. WGS_07 TaxID=3076764 RepID=UPI003872FE60